MYEQSAMAETEQDRALLPPRGAGLSAKAGKTFTTISLSIHVHRLMYKISVATLILNEP